jgi:WD40 repeat protein
MLVRWSNWRAGEKVVSKVAYSPDGRLLAVATSIGIYLYDANTLDEVRFIDRFLGIQRSLLAEMGACWPAGLVMEL